MDLIHRETIASETEITLDKLKQAVDKLVCDTTEIFIANGGDLLEMDMTQIPKNVLILSDMAIERGKMYQIVDKELKLNLFDFCTKHEDRCFHGLKEVSE